MTDAFLASQLLALAPQQLRGISLKGNGPARDKLLDFFKKNIAKDISWHRLPANIDQEGLLGGLDVADSLALGRAIYRKGLLNNAHGDYLVVPMAERLRNETAGFLAQGLDNIPFSLLMLDDGYEADEGPPPSLLDRVAFHADLSNTSTFSCATIEDPGAIDIEQVAELSDEEIENLASVSLALGVKSVRALSFAVACSRAHAALSGRKRLEQTDLVAAVRLVLAPRATQIPSPEPEFEEANRDRPTEQSDVSSENTGDKRNSDFLEEILVEAALAAIPPDILSQIASGHIRKQRAGVGAGNRNHSNLRGRPMSSRPGLPRGGNRLALIDTLRAAAPWQSVRRIQRRARSSRLKSIYLEKKDLRVRRFEQRAGTVNIFCVDASGSAAVSRLAEAKGAVERILSQAYVNRSEVALIAFRGERAELLLSPTRSLTRARRALTELPGGGGTPLASGLTLALQQALSVIAKGHTPFLVLLTDGSANIAADGQPGRMQAKHDALQVARSISQSTIEGVVIDISLRPRKDAADIAGAMAARYLPLPMADAVMLEKAIKSAQRSSTRV